MSNFVDGDIVRIKSTGVTGELMDINPRVDFDPEDEYWAIVQTDVQSFELDGPQEIEVVLTAREAQARKVPTEAEFAAELAHAAHGSMDYSIHESSVDGADIEIAGVTPEGLNFVAYATVTSVERADF